MVGDELRYHDHRFPIAPHALVSTDSTDVPPRSVVEPVGTADQVHAASTTSW